MATQATASGSGVVPSCKITPVPSRPTIPPSNNCPPTFDSNPGLNNGAKAIDSLGPPPEANHPNQPTLRKASVAHPSGVHPSVQAPGKRPHSQVNHCPEPTHLTSPHTVEHDKAMYATLPEPIHYLPLNGPTCHMFFHTIVLMPIQLSGIRLMSSICLSSLEDTMATHTPAPITCRTSEEITMPIILMQRYAVPHAAGPSHIRECDMVSHDPTVNGTVDNDLQWAEEEMEEMRDDPDADMEG
ncbi:hypothetical protein H2248_002095 [Termitomyces sp. 'cryptogamus']|nr:hypothetical protein H2248_002095 [Termitomyces sp. 'cryptogamus']